jgi:hypothetical protein
MRTFFFIAMLLAGCFSAVGQVDSVSFQQINGRYYSVETSYDADGVLLNRNLTILGSGDSATVINMSVAAPANAAQVWGSSVANSINMQSLVTQMFATWGALYTQITGEVYAVKFAQLYKGRYLNGAGSAKVRVFVFGVKYGDFNLVELPNGRLRLNGIDDPQTPGNEADFSHLFNPRSDNTVQVMSLPASDASLYVKRLTELKIELPDQAAAIDAIVAHLATPASNLSANVFVSHTGENQNKKPRFESLDRRVRLVFLD